MDQQLGEMELVQRTTTLGNATLTAGQVVLSVRNDDGSVGDNGLAVKKFDLFVLNVTQAGTTTSATATLLFEGLDVGLTAGGEELDGVALVVTNYSPVLSGSQ